MNPLNIITRDTAVVRTGLENLGIIVEFNSGFQINRLLIEQAILNFFTVDTFQFTLIDFKL